MQMHFAPGQAAFLTYPAGSGSEPVHKETLFCVNTHFLHHFGRSSTWILKTHFFCGKIRKRSPRIFVWRANTRTFRNDDAIAPSLDLLPLAAEDIEPFLQLTRIVVEFESQQQFDIIIKNPTS